MVGAFKIKKDEAENFQLRLSIIINVVIYFFRS